MSISTGFGKALCWGAFFVWTGLANVYAANPVRTVIDGDTVILQDGRHLRLIGINTPELGKDGAPDQPLARRARRALVDTLKNAKNIRLEYGPERRDHYGRVLAHIVVDSGRYAQEELLAQGLAWVVAFHPNVRLLEPYRNAETRARRQGIGVWSVPEYGAINAHQLRPDHTGFRLVRGQVKRIGKGKRLVYLNVNKKFVITVPKNKWQLFKSIEDKIVKRPVVARGWLQNIRGQLRLKITHPFMLGLGQE